MKLAIALLLALSGSAAHAETKFRTQDNVDRIIVLKKTLNADQKQACLKLIGTLARTQGNGNAQVVFDQGRTVIVAANLTSFGARKVLQSGCASSVRNSHDVGPHPSVGISN